MKRLIRIFCILAVVFFITFFSSGCGEKDLMTSLGKDEVTITLGKAIEVGVVSKDGEEITWEVEDDSIVTVNNGTIIGVKEGTTYVLVKSGSQQAKIKVTVKEKEGDGYTVLWLNYDYEVLEIDENVPIGTMPMYDGKTPTRTDFTFIGWDPEVSEVTADVTYIAQYTQEKVVTATWKNWDGTTLYVNHTVPYDTTPQYRGPAPTKESNELYDFMFMGWSPSVNAIKCNTTYIAQFAGIKRYYTVTWIDTAVYNSDTGNYKTVLYTEEVEAGTTPIYAGPEPEKPDDTERGYKYLFDGWDPIPSRLVNDMEFKTIYARAYDALWYNYYNELEELKVERFKMEEYTRPSGYKEFRMPDVTPYDGPTPMIFEDYGYTYEFIGWFFDDEDNSWNNIDWDLEQPLSKTYEREHLATYKCIPKEDNKCNVDDFIIRICEWQSFPSCEIIGYEGEMPAELYIPAWINGYIVTSIEYEAFRDNINIESLYIGDNVREIGQNAFKGCKNLTVISFGENMRKISHGMFEDCTGLHRVDIPEGIKEIGWYAFYGCTNLSVVTLPNSLEIMGPNCFSKCEDLKTVTIPDKVKWVKGFSGCIRLHTVHLGAGVIGIADFCFDGNLALREINLDKINLEHIGSYAFRECESLVTISLPDSLKTIGKKAFQECTDLLLVSFFGSNPQLESIDEWAFLECSSLTGLSIPASVTHIGEGIVGSCENLYSLEVIQGNQKYRSKSNMIIDIENEKIIAGCNGSGEIPTDSTITTIGSYAFYECKQFNKNKTLVIPDNIKKIESYAFYQCLGLPSLDPYSITFTDHDRHYEHCPKSVFVPSSIEILQSLAFYFDYIPEKGENKRYYCIYVDKFIDYWIRTQEECPEGIAYGYPQYSGTVYKPVFANNATIHYRYEGDPADYPRGVLGTAYGYWHSDDHVLWTFGECYPSSQE